MARGKGASDQRLLTPLRRMPGRSPEIPGDRRMNSKSRILYVFYQSRRTLTPPLTPPRTPPKARHSSGRPWESLWEGLEELWESFGRLGGSSGRLWRSSGRPWESHGCTVCTLYSVLTVQCAHCTVCSLYSVLTVHVLTAQYHDHDHDHDHDC